MKTGGDRHAAPTGKGREGGGEEQLERMGQVAAIRTSVLTTSDHLCGAWGVGEGRQLGSPRRHGVTSVIPKLSSLHQSISPSTHV